jgi:hypothetical protein
MKREFLLLAAAALFLPAADAQTAASSRERIEWCDIWISHANETGLPRVLLLGDSITRAYYPEVEKRLAGKAFVARLATTAFISDPMLLTEIAVVLDSAKFDVIHLNNGMHGWQHSEEEYEKAFPQLLATIRKHAPGAKLIWAATTPLKEDPKTAESSAPVDAKGADAGKLMLKADLTRVSDARIIARNAIALRIMQAEGIPVDDLHSPMAGHPGWHSDNVHFNGQGIAVQADQVAAEVRKLLP